MPKRERPAELPPFERAIFDALSFEAHQVRKIDLSIGPRSQTITMKFALTKDQIDFLDEMASPALDHALPAEVAAEDDHDPHLAHQLHVLADDGGIAD